MPHALFIPIVLGCLLPGGACVAFAVAVRNLLRAKRSTSWPTVDCTIVDSRVIDSHKGKRPKIVYRYQLGGRNFESARVVVGGQWETSGDGPLRIVQRFPKGSVATAALDPGNPSYSVLIPGVRFHQVLTVVLCGVILVVVSTMVGVVAQLVVAS